MAECQKITHEIMHGDTLYRIAQKYRTTVPMILLENPGVDPYNLQVGTKLTICSGRQTPQKPSMDELQMSADLDRRMQQFVGWMKIYLLSLGDTAARQRDAAKRVETAADRVVDVFEVFYPNAVVRSLREHFVRGYTLAVMSYANAQNNRDTQAAEEFKEQISRHAEDVAKLLAQYNRYYEQERIEDAMEELTEVIDRIVAVMRSGDIMAEFDAYETMDMWAGAVADYLTRGLRREFYREG